MLNYLQIQDLAIHFSSCESGRGWFVASLVSGFAHFPLVGVGRTQGLCSDQTTQAPIDQETWKTQGQWRERGGVLRAARHKACKEKGFTCPGRLMSGLRHFSHKVEDILCQQTLQHYVAPSVRLFCDPLLLSHLDGVSVFHWRPFSFLTSSPRGFDKLIHSLPTSPSSSHGHMVYT